MQKCEIKGNQATGILKLIALVCMITDHIGAVIYPQFTWLRVVGRIAFPLYAWCLAVGASYTRNMAKYIGRVLIVGVIAQPLYAIAMKHVWYDLNIFFTLALSLCAIWGIREKRWGSQFWALPLAMWVGVLCECDYLYMGLLLPVMLYLFRGRRWLIAIGMAVFCYIWGESSRSIAYLFGVSLSAIKQPELHTFVSRCLRLQPMAILSLPLMLIPFTKDIRLPAWVSYGLYPAHLIVIYILQQVL